MASVFTRSFQNGLRYELAKLAPVYQVFPGEKWLKTNGRRVVPIDIALKSMEKLVLIEIESHRQDPSNNIAKILFWLEQNSIKEKLLVIQLFSPFYNQHRIKRGVSEKLGRVIMERWIDQLSYRPLSFQPELSFDEFDRVYKNPLRNEHLLDLLIKETANEIIKQL